MPRKNRVISYTRPHAPFICTQKRGFLTKKDAEEAAEYQMLLKPKLSLATYQCDTCAKWHLTSSNPDNKSL